MTLRQLYAEFVCRSLISYARTDTYQYSFGARMWNNSPNYIKEINSIEQFKNQIINIDLKCTSPPVYSLRLRSFHT